MSQTLKTLTVLAALGCASMAGVFFAFSSFVMAGLGRLPREQGLAAMQSINVTAVRPVFMSALFGTAALCAGLGIRTAVRWGGPGGGLLLAGSLLYLVGCIGLTAAYHVPMNDTLAALDPHAAASVDTWTHYLGSWTTWNHVRAASGLGAAACFTLALLA